MGAEGILSAASRGELSPALGRWCDSLIRRWLGGAQALSVYREPTHLIASKRDDRMTGWSLLSLALQHLLGHVFQSPQIELAGAQHGKFFNEYEAVGGWNK
jgi:hypothetical protein